MDRENMIDAVYKAQNYLAQHVNRILCRMRTTFNPGDDSHGTCQRHIEALSEVGRELKQGKDAVELNFEPGERYFLGEIAAGLPLAEYLCCAYPQDCISLR